MSSKGTLRNALLMEGVTHLTSTQARILNETKSRFNNLIQGQPNCGQTLALIILMLNLVNVTQCSTQILLVSATRESARTTFKKAAEISKKMNDGIKCGLTQFDGPTDFSEEVHCLVGTSKSVGDYLKSHGILPRMVLFDDCNKSLSFDNDLLKFGAKYVCVSSNITRSLIAICNERLQAVQSILPSKKLLSPNLRHIEFLCASQTEKLDVTGLLCQWIHAKKILIFVLVRQYFNIYERFISRFDFLMCKLCI